MEWSRPQRRQSRRWRIPWCRPLPLCPPLLLPPHPLRPRFPVDLSPHPPPRRQSEARGAIHPANRKQAAATPMTRACAQDMSLVVAAARSTLPHHPAASPCTPRRHCRRLGMRATARRSQSARNAPLSAPAAILPVAAGDAEHCGLELGPFWPPIHPCCWLHHRPPMSGAAPPPCRRRPR